MLTLAFVLLCACALNSSLLSAVRIHRGGFSFSIGLAPLYALAAFGVARALGWV